MTAVSERRVHVIQGERQVSADPAVVLTTILGSCISACLRDPMTGVGGMNHFLLPGEDRAEADGARFGAFAMELLINDLLARGADRYRLEGKLFGGARMMGNLSDVGATNVSFATRYLEREGIRLTGGSTGGNEGRRIQFWPVSGRVRQIMLEAADVAPPPPVRDVRPAPTGDVELF